MRSTESMREMDVAAEAGGRSYDEHVAAQSTFVQAFQKLTVGLRGLAVLINVALLILGIVVTIRLAGEGSSLVGEIWAGYGLSWSFLVFAPGLEGLILRAWPVPMIIIDFFEDQGAARRRPVKTGWSGIWRAILVLWGGSPGAVYMVIMVTDVLPRLADAW